MFGNKPATGLFGSSANNSFGIGFGTTGFGVPAPASGGLFGTNNTTTSTGGGLFGVGGTNTFGSTPASSTGMTGFNFGTSTATVPPTMQAGGLFGTSTTGLGGAGPSTCMSLFSTSGNNTFGNTQAGTAGGLFGGTSFLGTTNTNTTGTVIKFIPVTGSDVMMKGGSQQSVSTKLQCITGMKEYENKSLEELRFEDYMANRKGPQQQQQNHASGFLGATTQTTQGSAFGVFGSAANKPAFTGFGATAGTGSSSLFGNPTSASTGSSLFGASSQPKSLFGSATTTTSTIPFVGGLTNTSIFGQSNTTKPGLFGTTATTQGVGLFGNTTAIPASTTSFGTGAFGIGSAFATGAQTGGILGQKQTVGFSGTAPGQAAGFSFGGSQQNALGGGSLFGAKPTTSATGFSFGQQATSTNFGGFGATSLSGTLGGTTGPFATGLGINLVSSANMGSSLFAQTQAKTATTGLGLGFSGFSGTGTNAGMMNIGNTATGGSGVQADLAAAFAQQQQLQILTTSPYGDSPLFRNLKQDSFKKDELMKPTNPTAQKLTLVAGSQFKVTSGSSCKIKPKPLQSIITEKGQLFDGLEEDESSESDTFKPRNNFKKLLIRNNGANSKGMISPYALSIDEDLKNSLLSDNTMRELNPKSNKFVGITDQHHDYSREAEDETGSSPADAETVTSYPHPAGIILHRPDYFTDPSLNELVEMIDTKGECWVENFVVGRIGYGNVFFPGMTNISGLNLDEIVHFRNKEIDLYPNEENKPPIGEELNKKAQVTLDRVWPSDKTTGVVITDYDRLCKMGYPEKLEKASRKLDAKFIEYRAETGSWVFEVKHFSKYGLLEDSDSDDDYVHPPVHSKCLKQQPPFQQMEQQKPFPKEIELQFQQNGKEEMISKEIEDGKRREAVALIGRHLNEEDTEMSDVMPKQFQTENNEDKHESNYSSLPRSLGVSATHVQLQKASFFGFDEEDKTEFSNRLSDFVNSSMMLGLRTHGKRHFSPSPQENEYTYGCPDVTIAEKERAGTSVEPLSGTTIHPLVPRALIENGKRELLKVRSSHELEMILYDESLFCGRQNLFMDHGLVNSKRFRIGWASGCTFTRIGHPLMATSDESIEATKFTNTAATRNDSEKNTKGLSSAQEIVIETINMSNVIPTTVDFLTDCLETELEYSEYNGQLDCPMFFSQNGIQLLNAYREKILNRDERSSDDLFEHMSTIWSLCSALWNDLDIPQIFSEDTYVSQQARKMSLAQWLTFATKATIEDQIQKHYVKGYSVAEVVFSYLTGGMIERACEHALDCKNYHLALLLSQSASSKTMLHQQLATWAIREMTSFIDKEHLKLYVLLAGMLVWKTSEEEINTCDGLDWKRSLAMHLWYMCSSSASIKEVVEEYEKAFDGSSVFGQYALPPRPVYMKEDNDDDVCVYDVCYHLLKLYLDRTYPLHVLLNPSTISGNQLDYAISWHLLQLLEGLNYHHLPELQHDMICVNYASQLESIGLWHWAVFVLLHIQNNNSCTEAVKKLLLRHVSLKPNAEDDLKESFIIERLHIQPEWIYFAKAVKAKSGGNHYQEAWYMLKAKKWNICHATVIKKVASEAIINDNLDLLWAYLEPLSDVGVISQIRDWNIGGGLFLDYLHILEKLHQIQQSTKQGENCVFEMEHLSELTSSLCTRINYLQCNNSTDSHCQSLMCDNIAQLLTLKNETRINITGQYLSQYKSTNLLSSLPMTEDIQLETLARISHALRSVIS